ncbi:MAG: hypothetical protein WCE52_05565 [Candidatus Acidiferrum sp.]
MMPPFDIFYVNSEGYIWQEPAESLESAKLRVQQLGVSRPGEYLIFSQETGDKLSIKVAPPTRLG